MPQRKKNAFDFLVAIVVNIILLYVFNNLAAWHFKYITPAFVAPLWILNISLVLHIIFNIIYLAYRAAWFRALTQAALNAFGAFVTYEFYRVFPFDFSSVHFNLGLWVKWLLLLGIVATAAVAVGEFVHFLVLVAKACRQDSGNQPSIKIE